MWCDVFDLLSVEIEHVKILVEARLRFAHEQSVVARREPRNREPAVALVDARGVVTGLGASLRVDVENGFVASVGGEGETFAVVTPAAPAMFGVGLVGERLDLAVRSESEELCALVAALVHAEDQLLTLGRERGGSNALVEEGALVRPSTGFESDQTCGVPVASNRKARSPAGEKLAP